MDVVRQRREQRRRGQRDRRDADGPDGLRHEREAAVAPRAGARVEGEQDEARVVGVAPREVAVQQGLEVVGGGGDARALGDLEGELAGVHLVDAQAGGDDAAGAAQVRRGRFEVGAARQRRLDGACGRSRRLVAGDARDPRPGQDGAHVGERVAPGVVVDRSDEDEVGAGRARGIGAGRDQRGRGSALAGGLQREPGRPGPSVVGDRDADAAGARVEGGVQRLARLSPGA